MALVSATRRVARLGRVWLRRTLPGTAGFENSRRLSKWLLLGTTIGCVAGLGSVFFYGAIQVATHALLSGISGYQPPGPAGEGAAVVTPIGHRLLLPLVTAIGGLVSGLIVLFLAPEAEGHGTDAAIEAIHRKGGEIRARVVPVKLIASAITIGSGGSAGREGPAAHISAGFASLLGRKVLSSPEDRRIAVAAGIGAGIGAIFRAPLGGAVLAAEILYLHDLEVEAIIPSLIASIVGYTIFGGWFGFEPIFGQHASLSLGAPVQLVYYAVLGVLCGVGGLLYARAFYRVAAWFDRSRLPRWTRPAVGGLAVGLLGLAMPQVIHTGYGWVQVVMTRDGVLAFSPLLLAAIAAGKIAATSLSIGSGGSGGIFGPGMVIGGFVGALLWRVAFGHVPGLPAEPAPFVIIGMMALFGGIAHAPLAVMLMVAEMTGTLSLLAPAMIAVAASTAMVGDETIYRAQLRDRASSPLHRIRFSLPMLAALRVRDAMEPISVSAAESDAVRDVLHRLQAMSSAGALVRDRDGQPIGTVTRDALERMPEADGQSPVSLVVSPVTLHPDQTLEDAMQELAQEGAGVAVVMQQDRPAGIVTSRTILRAYRSARERQDPRGPRWPPDPGSAR
ncbi:chloride channel protein [Anaeromyxobacter sp. Red801]|uniref:chloride channel protein n=1 Tax=Anaeromyxobacter sp. Red801 TaxID=3411632 RepID=UPI003B9F1858